MDGEVLSQQQGTRATPKNALPTLNLSKIRPSYDNQQGGTSNQALRPPLSSRNPAGAQSHRADVSVPNGNSVIESRNAPERTVPTYPDDRRKSSTRDIPPLNPAPAPLGTGFGSGVPDGAQTSRSSRPQAAASLANAKPTTPRGTSGGTTSGSIAPLTARPSTQKSSWDPPPQPLTDSSRIKGTVGAPHTIPLSPHAALKLHASALSPFEQSEILEYNQIFFVGAGANKIRNGNAANNNGFDDERGDYIMTLHDHFSYRYEVLLLLGKGSFGQVVKAFDYKTNQLIALKIIRNKKRFHHQALVEVKILEHLRDHDHEDSTNIIRMNEYFYFRNHLCITFELLSINLYEFIKNNNFQGLSLSLIRRFAIQLLTSLRFQRKHRIIHCDLKPENILLKQANKSGIKVIDYGSSCFEDERVYTYIQSRFYRAPEVILGLPYNTAIDMWSLGCILAELYTGYPLFPGENEVEQLACVMEVLGLPPKRLVDSSTRKKMFFDSQGNPRIVANSRGKKRRPASKDMMSAIKCNDPVFVSFLESCLRWDMRERATPEDGLQHEWILEATQPAPTFRSSLNAPLSPPPSSRERHTNIRKSVRESLNGPLLAALGSSTTQSHGSSGQPSSSDKDRDRSFFPPIDSNPPKTGRSRKEEQKDPGQLTSRLYYAMS
mmetsp:Transcript_21928/g.36325  ORF Transcript_21928/g.36325 Transcript_21928/m.36325 type:complete len:662 (+) Transcript_21928:218-2203(+)|eukprot:CAMPEP_0184646570 /NCGR_PEP_ID=MMETSP0308-20130426/3274_1 /TAXON_ID=38269 /ORGANISM="Gloeochaete witrockiana, Strain SAG 46.84" /LENGTH=661 /DNA_ID=CAMNT_0027076687 /DNA_START=169 /DNA_END=2154 /DNA_ORIENTATION=-